MSQPRPYYHLAGARCPPVPIPRGAPPTPARWPVVVAAAALGGLLLTLVTLTAWVSAHSPRAEEAPPPDVQVATPDVAPEMPAPLDPPAPAGDPPAPVGPALEPAIQPGPVALAPPLPGPRPAPAAVSGEDQAMPPCQNFGTAVDYLSSPTVAARQADKTKKLLFVLHISGNFECDRFT